MTKMIGVVGACLTLSFFVGHTLAGFAPDSKQNLAIYWGQNSADDKTAQSRLADYCKDTLIDIIPLAFMDNIKNPTSLNFANAGDNCTAFPGTSVLSCPQIEADIHECQAKGKTILLSIGGSTYLEGGFASPMEAEQWATKIWATFGPIPADDQQTATVDRPFGSAVLDGVDFDFEAHADNMAPFASKLRALMDAAKPRRFYLSAAPQCPFPDQVDDAMLSGGVAFDFLHLQYYNNPCGASHFDVGQPTQSLFNFDVWNDWASTNSSNKNVKLLLGLAVNATEGGGYVTGDQLVSVVDYSRNFSHFGGVMLWDMSQLSGNPGYLEQVVGVLGRDAPLTTSSLAYTAGPGQTSAALDEVSTLESTSVMTTSSTDATTQTTTASSPVSTDTVTSPTTTTKTHIRITLTTTLFIITTMTSEQSQLPTTTTSGVSSPPSPTTTTATSSSAAPPSTSLVHQWGQCGGRDYTGPTACQPPFRCVVYSPWWSDCR